MAAPAISVVVPVYNGSATLAELARRVDEALRGRAYELVLVNDGSADESWRLIGELSREHPQVRGLDLMRNYGQHNALLAGIRSARGAVVVTIDDDLQNPPEEIPKLVERLEEGDVDVVYGSAAEQHYGFWRGLGTRLSKLALRVAIGIDVASRVSAFRAFRTDLRTAFEGFEAPYVSIDVLLNWGARRYAFVTVEHRARDEGRSSYSFGRLATHALNVLTGFSTRPLRWASLLGLAFTLFGVAILVLVVVRSLVEESVPGFPFLASIIAIFSGVQLLTLGVIGEYLGRMHGRVMDRPAYAVREEVGADG
ncbi:MAG: glycosyltransferase family 2 protein [Actinomycetota bacterium]|nr:glycosyltransferase family 2 protein [Actinomycetota bacterium]